MAKIWKFHYCPPTSYDLLWHCVKIFGNNNSTVVHHFHFSILVPPLVYLFCFVYYLSGFVYYLALLFHNQDHQYYCLHGHLKGISFILTKNLIRNGNFSYSMIVNIMTNFAILTKQKSLNHQFFTKKASFYTMKFCHLTGNLSHNINYVYNFHS